MFVVVTESNLWERERWHYLLDLSNLDSEILNSLMLFVRISDKQYYEDRVRECRTPVAVSKYSIRFYDEYTTASNGEVTLINKNASLVCNGTTTYRNSMNICVDRKISKKRLHSAVVTIRDKRDNKLYKNFESLFLKKEKSHEKSIS